MPCNTDTCSKYSPQNNQSLGIQMEKGIYPYPAGARRINAPSWDRDRVMYDFEDVCSAVVPSSRYSTSSLTTSTTDPKTGTTTSSTSTGYGFNSVNSAGNNAGKLYEALPATNWWESYRACQATTLSTYPAYSGSVQKTRYWNHYPSELSFEPIFSDTWFYYLFDTLNGVTGIPCAAYCFTVTYLYSAGGGGKNPYVSYVYNVTKTPYACPCTPDETYIKYNLEDGLTNPAYNQDPYPTFWSIGTKRTGIAFKYATRTVSAGSITSGAILKFRPKHTSEKFLVWKDESQTPVWLGLQTTPFFRITGGLPNTAGQPTSAFKQGNLVFRTYSTNVTFSNGMVLNVTIEGRTGGGGNGNYSGNGALYLKVNNIISVPTGGWSSSTVDLVMQSPDFGAFAPKLGEITIEPVNVGRNLPGKKMGVPKDFAFRESKFTGGLYAVSGISGWSTWFNTYAVWTNNKQNNLVGRTMVIVNRKIPVSAGTYTMEYAIDDGGSFELTSYGVQREDGEVVLSSTDENRVINITGGFNSGTPPSTTFSVTKSGYINLICTITNGGTNTSWSANPGAYAVVLKKNSQIVWTTRDAVTGENGGDCFRGMTLTESGWVDAWDGNNGIPFRSNGPNSGRCWRSNNTVVYKDYQIPGGLTLRVKLQSEFDSVNNRYNTIWKITNILKSGEDYQPGNGVDWIDQQKFTLFYPTKDDPERISLTLLITETVDSGDALPLDIDQKRLASGMSVNGWTISDVRESNDELNMHYAEIRGGTADFTKDTTYTVSNGQQIIVKAGWGIKDRACLIGLYEFRKKEIEYGVGVPTPGVPFAPELIKPKCVAEIVNGRVNSIRIISRGRGLTNRNIETPKIVVEPPPTAFNHDLYNQLINQGVTVEKAKNRSKGSGKTAQLRSTFSNGRLVSVEVIDGGSGYSSTNPPNVYVPYIAKVETNIIRPTQNPDIVEEPSKAVFEKSPIFQNFAKTSYDKPTYTIDSKTGKATITGSVKASGFNWNDYKKQTADASKEINYQIKRVDIETMTLSDTKRQTRYEDRGVDKKFIQSFKPGGSTKNIKNVETVKSKTSDNIVPPNPSMLSKGDTARVASYVNQVDKADDKYGALPNKTNPSILGPSSLPSSSNKDSLAKSAFSEFTSAAAVSKVTLSPPSESQGNVTYAKEFKEFTRKMGIGNAAAFDPNIYKDNKTQVRKDTGKYINTIPTILDSQEKSLSNTLDEMWQRDEERNRVGTWNNTEMRVTKQSFFNLPCRNDKEIYLMRRFCPDPRPWTTITLRLGVIKNLPDPSNPDLTVCKKCLQDQPALISLRNSLRSQFGDNTLDVEDAYCVSVYGLPLATWYAQSTGGLGNGYDGTTYAVPFGNTGYTGGTYFNRLGSLKNFTGYQPSDTEYPDGCRSYEVAGRLLIYHSLTNETNLWAAAVSSYGNPYDFICGRTYGDSGEEEIYITEDAISTENSDSTNMPGNYTYTINGQTIDSGISQTVPEEGY